MSLFRLAKGPLIQISALVLSAGFLFLSQVLLARGLTPHEYGQIASLFSLASVLGLLASFGFGQHILNLKRESSQKIAKEIKSSFSFTILFSALCITAMIIWWPTTEKNISLIIPFSIFLTLQSINNTCFSIEQRNLKSYATALNRIQIPLLRFIASTIAIAAGYKSFLLALSILFLLAFIYSTWRFKEYLEFTPKSINISTLKHSFYYGLESLLSVFLLNICSITLGFTKEYTVLANISSALSFILAIYLIPQAVFVNHFHPQYIRINEDDPLGLFKKILNSSIISLAIGIIFSIALYAISPYLIEVSYGKNYHTANSSLQILALSIPLRFFSIGIGCYIATRDFIKYRAFAGTLACMAFFAIISIIPGTFGKIETYSLAFVSSQMTLALIYTILAFIKRINLNTPELQTKKNYENSSTD